MEKLFTCSKAALKKARITCMFYGIGLPVIAVLFVLPFFWGGENRLSWHLIIYALLAAFFVYSGYRAFRVLRSLRDSRCRTDGVTVSGIHTKDPYQKGVSFQIDRKDITNVKDTVSTTVKKEDIDYNPRTLHRAPFESPNLRGYRSTIIETGNASYLLFGIELTDELKNALKPE
jgi:hypothetical protein